MALSFLIHASMSKVSTNIMLCSDKSLTGRAKLCCRFEHFQESQKSLVSDVYIALKYNVKVENVTKKLILTWRWNYEKHINVLESQTVVLETWSGWRQRADTGRRIIFQTDSQVLQFISCKGQSGSSTLWRLSGRIGALCLPGKLRIEPVWVASEENTANVLSTIF